jgi:hypothetical protein
MKTWRDLEELRGHFVKPAIKLHKIHKLKNTNTYNSTHTRRKEGIERKLKRWNKNVACHTWQDYRDDDKNTLKPKKNELQQNHCQTHKHKAIGKKVVIKPNKNLFSDNYNKLYLKFWKMLMTFNFAECNIKPKLRIM